MKFTLMNSAMKARPHEELDVWRVNEIAVDDDTWMLRGCHGDHGFVCFHTAFSAVALQPHWCSGSSTRQPTSWWLPFCSNKKSVDPPGAQSPGCCGLPQKRNPDRHAVGVQLTPAACRSRLWGDIAPFVALVWTRTRYPTPEQLLRHPWANSAQQALGV